MKPGPILSLAAIFAIGAASQSDPWASLRIFEGKWEGATSGEPGKGTTSREYKFELNGQFLWQSDHSVYQPQDPSGKPVDHQDLGFFSYDTTQKKIRWRQFHSEGYVNEYALSQLGVDAKSLEFVTTNIENLPGFRAKKVYRIVSANEIEETFYLAQPGKDFEIYTTANLKRVK